MPIRFRCTCGKQFSVADQHAGKRTKCSTCGAALTIPQGRAEPTGIPATPNPFPADLFDELPAANPLVNPVGTEVLRTPAAVTRRTSNLRLFVIGLGFHYAGMVVFLLSMVACWFAIALFVGGEGTGIPLEYLSKVIGGLFVAGGMLAMLATVIESPACSLCLTIPDGTARACFTGSLLLRVLSGLAAVGILLGNPNQMAVGASVAALVSWSLWMWGLRQAAVYLGDENLANEGPRLLVGGFLRYLLAVATLFAAVYLGVVLQMVPTMTTRLLFLVALPGIGFVLAWGIGVVAGLETWEVLLYPTGITFFSSYLDLIGTLRRKAGRR